MNGFSEKVFIRPDMPTEDAALSDHRRLLLALEARGHTRVELPLPMLQRLSPLCRDARGITVTLVHREWDSIVTALESGDTTGHHYGLAVDYGSTTVLMRMIDMNSGAVIHEAKAVNGQVAYGTDILTRITYTVEDPARREDLQKATVQTFHDLLDELTEQTGIAAAELPVMILSGNTAMIHFLLKLDAWTVFASPYAPVTMDPGFFRGRELDINFEGLIYIIPAASNYIGGDIISGLLKLELHRQERPSLFFDIGTNGELVIGCKDWMMAGAGAAGPALEGYISRFGMRAADGAVDSVAIRGENLTFTTVGGKKPVGICGSGIIDLLAQMRLEGWIDIAGRLNENASSRIIRLEEEGQYAAVYALAEESASGRPLFFTQQDILQYLDTKAAAVTMVECLLDMAGMEAGELENLYLSGAFPAHSDLESAITVGIFPDIPRERYRVLSNTSLEGASALLQDRSRLREAKELAEKIYCVQFASVPDFLVRMHAAKFVPHTDMERFPSVQNRIMSIQKTK